MNYAKKIALFRPPSRSIESESVLSFDDAEDDDKDNVKRKTRNLSEKKRRDQFNVLINELSSMVAANTKKMDKSTVLKSAIQFLRNHQEFSVQSAANEIKEDWKPTFLCNEEFAQLMLEAVESFLVVFTQQGKVLFVSDSVTSLLGHLPSDLLHNSLYDLIHEDDRLKLFNILSKFQTQGINVEGTLSFTGHLRRGTIDPTEPAVYECVKFCGSSQLVDVGDVDLLCENSELISLHMPAQSLCFCCTVRLQTSHIIREMSIVDEATSEFTSRHSLEWKFLFLDHRAPPIIGYLPFEVLGTSGYDYYHPDDLEVVSRCHEQLMLMGKGKSNCYRFLTKGQQWIWLQTRYFVTYHQWNSKPEFIVCTNTVVGYGEVRRQLRRDMGYIEGDATSTAVNSTTNSGSSSSDCQSEVALETAPQQEGLVSSFSQPEGQARTAGKIVQSPDVASSQHSENDRTQQPHSTRQESSSRRHISSQLQSLLQLHLQRTLATSAASASATGHAVNNTSTHNTTAVIRPAGVLLAPSSQAKVTGSCHSIVMSAGQQVMTSQDRVLPSLVPLMTAMSTNLGSVSANQRFLNTLQTNVSCNSSEVVPSPLTSPVVSTGHQNNYQPGLVLTQAQQQLHEQLVHKSEQLQSAIQQQQEELRFIQEQLAYAHSGSQMLSQAGPQQNQQQQQQHQQQLQHQYVLHQRLASQSMMLTPVSGSGHFAMMSPSSNHIFLSPITNVNMGLSATHAGSQQSHHSQVHCSQGQQQLVVPNEAGQATGSMLMTTPAPSPTSQLAMIGSGSGHIFLSPSNMDMLPPLAQQQQQQQQHCHHIHHQEQQHQLHHQHHEQQQQQNHHQQQQQQTQDQSLHFLGVSCSSTAETSGSVE